MELNELNDVTSGWHSLGVSDTATIAVQSLHRREVGPSDTNNDDRAWHLRKLTDQVNSRWHVVDCTVSQEQEDLVLAHTHSRYDIVFELSQERSEQGWTTKTDLRECLSVGVDNSLDSNDVGISSVAIHGEAVVNTVLTKVTGNTSETEDGEAFVIVVGLNDHANVHESRLVLVVGTHEVKRVLTAGVTV